MGSGGYSEHQVFKRNPEPEYLTNIRTELYNKIMPGLEGYNTEDWNTARQTASNALKQQSQLLSQLPDALNKNSAIANEIAEIARTGNIPTGVQDKLNASVNQELQSGMGSLLNNLAGRGVVNSSIMSQGVNNLSKQAADAYNRNYITAYQTALSGLGSAMQGQQANTNALLSGVNSLGSIPSQAYEGAAAQLMPAFNLWKAMQSSYDNREDYDTVVTQEPSSCITGDTTVRLADGREIPVSELNENDEIQAWDFEHGCTLSVPLTAFFRRNRENGADVIRVAFEDGSTVGVIKEHLFFDLEAGKFVAVNKDSQDFVGHDFAKVCDSGKVIPVKVKKVYPDGKATETYAPQTGYLNFIAEGFITGNDGQLGLCNMFDFDTDSMAYDIEKKATDLEKFGMLDYSQFKEIISREFFDAHRFEEFSVAFGKGLLNMEQFKEYLTALSGCFLV